MAGEWTMTPKILKFNEVTNRVNYIYFYYVNITFLWNNASSRNTSNAHISRSTTRTAKKKHQCFPLVHAVMRICLELKNQRTPFLLPEDGILCIVVETHNYNIPEKNQSDWLTFKIKTMIKYNIFLQGYVAKEASLFLLSGWFDGEEIEFLLYLLYHV